MKYLFSLLVAIACINYGLNAQYASPVDSLADLIKKDKEDTNKISHLNRMGWELMYENPDTSIMLSNQAMDLCVRLLESEDVKNRPDVQKSIKRRLAQTFNCLGVFYWVVSDYTTSIKYHQKALAMRKMLQDRVNEGSSLNNLGLVYKAKGDYNEALKNYFAALSIAIEFENKGLIATDLTNIGTVYHDMKDPKRAMEFYSLSLPMYRAEGDMMGMAMGYAYIGNAQVDLGNPKESLKYYSKGISISREISNIYLEAFMVNNMGEVYSKLHDDQTAIGYFEKSLPMAREIGEMALVATVLGNLGSASFKLHRYEESEKYLKEALEIAQKIEADPNIELIAWDLSKVYAKTNRYELAYKTQSLYIAAHDSLYNDKKTKELGQIETKHELAWEAREKQRDEEERQRKIKAEKNRKDLLQISGIVLLLVIFGLIVMVLGFKKVSPKVANGITFFATLILFEFLLVLFDPAVDKISNGEPAYKLLCNAILALGIFPVHSLITRLLKSRLSKKQSN